MTEGNPPPRDSFEDRLRDLRKRTDEASGRGEQGRPAPNAMGLALRIGIELVAGLVVGGGIGWLLDHWLGTGPWLLVLFFFLGAAAGIWNVFRSARELNRGDFGGEG